MMNITVVAVGKLRNGSMAELCEDYARRLGGHGHRLEIVEVRDEPGDRSREEILGREAGRISGRIPEAAWTVALDLTGRQVSSTGLARRLQKIAAEGRSRMAFIIGGPLGLDRELVGRCDWVLSLSRLTLPHEMARLVLLEQLYRASTIIRGEPYHK